MTLEELGTKQARQCNAFAIPSARYQLGCCRMTDWIRIRLDLSGCNPSVWIRSAGSDGSTGSAGGISGVDRARTGGGAGWSRSRGPAPVKESERKGKRRRPASCPPPGGLRGRDRQHGARVDRRTRGPHPLVATTACGPRPAPGRRAGAGDHRGGRGRAPGRRVGAGNRRGGQGRRAGAAAWPGTDPTRHPRQGTSLLLPSLRRPILDPRSRGESFHEPERLKPL